MELPWGLACSRLAFASNFKVLMFGDSIIMPLFLFNLGIEADRFSLSPCYVRSVAILDIPEWRASQVEPFRLGRGFRHCDNYSS